MATVQYTRSGSVVRMLNEAHAQQTHGEPAGHVQPDCSDVIRLHAVMSAERLPVPGGPIIVPLPLIGCRAVNQLGLGCLCWCVCYVVISDMVPIHRGNRSHFQSMVTIPVLWKWDLFPLWQVVHTQAEVIVCCAT